MKLRPVTNSVEKNIETLKIFSADAILSNCDAIDNFPTYDQFGTIGKPNSGCMVSNTYIFIIVIFDLYLTKTEKRFKYLRHSSHTISWSIGTVFVKRS